MAIDRLTSALPASATASRRVATPTWLTNAEATSPASSSSRARRRRPRPARRRPVSAAAVSRRIPSTRRLRCPTRYAATRSSVKTAPPASPSRARSSSSVYIGSTARKSSEVPSGPRRRRRASGGGPTRRRRAGPTARRRPADRRRLRSSSCSTSATVVPASTSAPNVVSSKRNDKRRAGLRVASSCAPTKAVDHRRCEGRWEPGPPAVGGEAGPHDDGQCHRLTGVLRRRAQRHQQVGDAGAAEVLDERPHGDGVATRPPERLGQGEDVVDVTVVDHRPGRSARRRPAEHPARGATAPRTTSRLRRRRRSARLRRDRCPATSPWRRCRDGGEQRQPVAPGAAGGSCGRSARPRRRPGRRWSRRPARRRPGAARCRQRRDPLRVVAQRRGRARHRTGVATRAAAAAARAASAGLEAPRLDRRSSAATRIWAWSTVSWARHSSTRGWSTSPDRPTGAA